MREVSWLPTVKVTAAAFLREFAGGPFAARVASLREAPAREAQ